MEVSISFASGSYQPYRSFASGSYQPYERCAKGFLR